MYVRLCDTHNRLCDNMSVLATYMSVFGIYISAFATYTTLYATCMMWGIFDCNYQNLEPILFTTFICLKYDFLSMTRTTPPTRDRICLFDCNVLLFKQSVYPRLKRSQELSITICVTVEQIVTISYLWLTLFVTSTLRDISVTKPRKRDTQRNI